MTDLIIAGTTFRSRLFLGTGKYGGNNLMKECVLASGSELVTVAMKRISNADEPDDILTRIRETGVKLLPNTSGARTADEAVLAAAFSKELFGTNWLKLEIHPDPRYLLPDACETLRATEALVKQGYVVLPYCPADPVLCKRLEEAGAAAVMPLGAPIGSNAGLLTNDFLQIIVEQATVPVVVDAGIGTPGQAACALELGVDAVMVNTAIASSRDATAMAIAFREAVIAGRRAYEAGLGAVSQKANASSPLTDFLN